MRKETYVAKSGRTMYRPVISEKSLYSDSESKGFCIACGQTAYGVEPDARRYTCEHCAEPRVYGLEELVMMGLAKVR